MFAFKTEVLGHSGTTAATGLTSFIYLKYQKKKNIHEMKDPSTNMCFEGKDNVYKLHCNKLMVNAIFGLKIAVSASLHEIMEKNNLPSSLATLDAMKR